MGYAGLFRQKLSSLHKLRYGMEYKKRTTPYWQKQILPKQGSPSLRPKGGYFLMTYELNAELTYPATTWNNGNAFHNKGKHCNAIIIIKPWLITGSGRVVDRIYSPGRICDTWHLRYMGNPLSPPEWVITMNDFINYVSQWLHRDYDDDKMNKLHWTALAVHVMIINMT